MSLQEDEKLTSDILQRAVVLLEAGIEPARIREILPAVQRNRDFFRPVRELEIGDEIEPSLTFTPKRSGGG